MGVKGLWQLLEPVGRPITLESLENKILGVDASLIINQSVKGMRDRHGNPVPNAHLVGLFNRVCKLLYYRIKPVFVFDGGVPHLKKKTLAIRNERRFKAMHGSKLATDRIVKNILKAKALETVTGKKSTSDSRSRSPREPDVFELEPLPASNMLHNKSSSEDEDSDMPLLDQFCSQQLEETFQNPRGIKIDSEDFKALPPEIQHELIKEMKEEKKWMDNSGIPKQANDFSSFQLEGVLQRGKMNQRLDELRKEMNERNSGDLAGLTSHDSLGDDSTVQSQKILSEDTAHYILIKTQEQNKQDINNETCPKDFSSEGGFFQKDQDCEIVTWTTPRPKLPSATKVPSFDIPDVISSDSEILSPFMDVAEACISPTSPQAKQNLFQFSPVKQTTNFGEAVAERENINVVEESWKQKCEDSHSPASDNEGEIFKETMTKTDQLCVPELYSTDNGCGDGLLTQIIDKKKELDDLIMKWEQSRQPDQNASLQTKSDNQTRTTADIKRLLDKDSTESNINMASENSDKPQGFDSNSMSDNQTMTSADSKELLKDSTEYNTSTANENLEKQQGFDSNFSEIQSTSVVQTTVANSVTCQSVESERISEDVVRISESESESRSVEELPSSAALDDVEVIEESGSDNQRHKAGHDVVGESHVEIGQTSEDKPYSLEESAAMAEVETVAIEKNPFDPAVKAAIPVHASTDMNQSDANNEELRSSQTQCEDGKEMFVIEDEEQPETSWAQVDQEPGPSSLPSEWQGASVEDLEVIQTGIESERKSLASEQARQNRIAATISNEMYTECQELLQLFGVPYLVSPMEAEAQCAMLDVLDLTDGSITDDSDIFLFGGRRVYKNIFNQNKHAEMYGSDAVKMNLALNRPSLICLAFITGSDYTEGIPGVGVVGAMEILHEFSGENLEGLKKFKIWHEKAQEQTKFPQETKVKRKLRSVTLPGGFPSEEVYEAYISPVVDHSTEHFEWGKPDLHSLRLFASDKFGWSSSRTDELLLPVLKQLNQDQTQMKINQFFQVKFQETRTIKSKRLRQVINRTRNPSSNGDSGDEQDKKKKKSRSVGAGEVPGKVSKGKQPKKTSAGNESETVNVTEVNRPEVNSTDEACSSRANRCTRGERGRGRGRTRLSQHGGVVNATPDLEATINLTPVKCPKEGRGSKRFTKNSGKSFNGALQPTSSTASGERDAEDSTSDDSEIEVVRRQRRKRPNDNEQNPSSKRGHLARGRGRGRGRSKGMRAQTSVVDLEKEEDSTSDSSASSDDSGKFYDGPKPASVFQRGRGRGKRRGRGRGR